MKTIAAIQSSYIPWKGFFDIIHAVDEFILLDDVQYTRRDWRNRNKIKSPDGTSWLTIPVKSKGNYSQPIHEVLVDGHAWTGKHLASIRHTYGKCPGARDVLPRLEEAYARCSSIDKLSRINALFLETLCKLLGITTPITWSMDYDLSESDPTRRLVELALKAEAQVYLSGPAARDYLDESAFSRQGIQIAWMHYGPYPQYDQPYPPFLHEVSVIDLLMSVGTSRAPKHAFAFSL